jgi:hypothetical protein
MPVTQLFSVVGHITSGGGGGGVDPTATMIAVFDSDDPHRGSGGANGWWTGNGSWYAASIFSSPPPAWNAITYAASPGSGHTYDFTGSHYMIGPALGNSGLVSAFSISYWFYPTTNNCQLVSEYGTSDYNAGYHYSMLELDSSGHVLARCWPNGGGTHLTSQTTVNLNAWNYIHYIGTGSGVYSLSVNNYPYVSGNFAARQGPSTSAFAFGVSDITSINNTNNFQGKIGYFSYQNDPNGTSMWGTLASRYGL